MVEKMPLPKDCWGVNWELTVKDTVFSWPLLYKWFHEYLKEKGFKDVQNVGIKPVISDNYEVFYSDTDLGNGMKSQWVWFRAVKEPVVSGGQYLRMYFKLDIQTILVSTKEVMHKGQKVKLNGGEYKFICKIWFFEDNSKKWSKHPILKYFQEKFWNRLHQAPISATKAEIVKYSNEIYKYIQTYTGILPPEGPKEYYSAIQGKEN